MVTYIFCCQCVSPPPLLVQKSTGSTSAVQELLEQVGTVCSGCLNAVLYLHPPAFFFLPSPPSSSLLTSSPSSLPSHPSQSSPVVSSEARLFHFVQEQHRRDSELATARRKWLELEDTLRDLQERCVRVCVCVCMCMCVCDSPLYKSLFPSNQGGKTLGTEQFAERGDQKTGKRSVCLPTGCPLYLNNLTCPSPPSLPTYTHTVIGVGFRFSVCRK